MMHLVINASDRAHSPLAPQYGGGHGVPSPLLDRLFQPSGSAWWTHNAPTKTRSWTHGRILGRSKHREMMSPVAVAYDESGGGPTRVGFAVSSPALPLEDVLEVPDIRGLLEPQPSPFVVNNNYGGGFVDEDDRVAISSLKFASSSSLGAGCTFALDSSAEFPDGSHICMPLPAWAVRAGARRTIYFNPRDTKVAIVTCGGLCPGLNDVVEGLVHKCQDYGVSEGNIFGIRYGLKGFYDSKHKPIILTKKNVESIHLSGGTLLGTSRGGADIHKIVKSIDIQGFDVVFVVGGNGGNAGAAAIQEALTKAKVPCAVIGVPKSIDNDILLVSLKHLSFLDEPDGLEVNWEANWKRR